MVQDFPVIRWSDRLESLADGMIEEWKNTVPSNGGNAFEKICVVVQDNSVRDWLKKYCFIEKKDPWIMMNVEFVMMPEFLNDWLAAQTRGISPYERRPAEHPYARPVLPWRIYHILEQNADDPAFRELTGYIGDDESNAAFRRYDLSVRLANLYDDYLNARFFILKNWEEGRSVRGAPVWQEQLYRMLYDENKNSYASMYADALKKTGDPQKAFTNGFPRYRAVHIFDIPFIQYPALCMLKKISSALPLVFWTFNPGKDWLAESPSKPERTRALARRIREAHSRCWQQMQEQKLPEIFEEQFFDDPGEQLAGTMASGTRALLAAQLDDEILGGVSWDDICDPQLPRVIGFNGIKFAAHSCISPRRELEAVKDGLHRFFAENPDASPGDVLVLCADWKTYAPLLADVFDSSPETEGYIPVATGSYIQETAPLVSAFKTLITFYKSRFEATAVFELLEYPAIRKKFGLDENSIAVIQDFLKQANIRWGADDGHIAEILQCSVPEPPYPFSWQRGLDRLILDMLYGGINDEDPPVDAGNAGKLVPCADVEGNRAKILVSLWSFVDSLRKMCRKMTEQQLKNAAEWMQLFYAVTDEFFEPDTDEEKDVAILRKAVRETVSAMTAAGEFAQNVDLEVMTAAVISACGSKLKSRHSSGDTVTFAPLDTAAATPHRLVWICGLKNGSFPRINRPASFDLIWKNPGVFDISPREKDLFAFLKAALSARQQLVFSFIRDGQDSAGDPALPLLLEEFKEYVTKEFDFYYHPVYAYHQAYFSDASGLPPVFSAENAKIAETIRNNETATPKELMPFDITPGGTTVIDAAVLAEFCASPQRFLTRNRLNIKTLYINGISDESALETVLDNNTANRIFELAPDESAVGVLAEHAVERGMAPDRKSAAAAIADIAGKGSERLQKRVLSFKAPYIGDGCPGLTLADAWKKFKSDAVFENTAAEIEAGGNRFELRVNIRKVKLQSSSGNFNDFTMYFHHYGKVSLQTYISNLVMHLAGHAAGMRFFTVILDKPGSLVPVYPPVDGQTAQEMLRDILCSVMMPVVYDPSADTPFMEQYFTEQYKKFLIKTGYLQ